MKREVNIGESMKAGVVKRAFRNLMQIPAWFSPWKKFRVFFHRIKGVKIGKNVEIGYMVLIDNRRPELVTIEDKATITTMSVVITHDFSKRWTEGKEIIGEVLIKEGAFIGMNSTILPGITIGKNCIIGSGSVVTRDTEDDSVYVGVPAKRIK